MLDPGCHGLVRKEISHQEATVPTGELLLLDSQCAIVGQEGHPPGGSGETSGETSTCREVAVG